MANILITGGTGLVGSRLSMILHEHGHTVSHLSRSPKDNAQFKQYGWDIKKREIDAAAFEGLDTIIHLAGAGVADSRWTDARKKAILNSRVDSTRLLFEKVQEYNVKLSSYISASAIGIYGSDLEKEFDEESAHADDFLANVVEEWEASADLFQEITKVAKVRIGVVLSEKGGAMAEIAKPIKMLVGAPLGSGKQWMSWIHVDDLVGIFEFILDKKLEGVYNAVAPNPVTNEKLTKEIAKVLKKPLLLPNVPAFVMKLMLGEMSQIVLEGSKVKADLIISKGYQFQFEQVDNALKDLLHN